MAANGGDCESVLGQFAQAGINVENLAEKLQDESAKSFVNYWNELLGVIASKSNELRRLLKTSSHSMNILVIDVGGAHIKVLATGQKEPREIVSGPAFTAKKMVAGVRELTRDWPYDVVAMGYPGPVLHNHPVAEPHNLGPGWVGFNFSSAFRCPVRIVNDAAMQALGGYRRGKLLFLGFGTGLGSALIMDGIVEPMELGHLSTRRPLLKTMSVFVDWRFGKKKWCAMWPMSCND